MLRIPTCWEAVIGIEVHAQINTKSKLFSDSSTSYNDPINTHVSAVDAAFPGVQPRLNEHAVELAVKTAIALQGQVQKRLLLIASTIFTLIFHKDTKSPSKENLFLEVDLFL
ncbi:unnamed protein product [Mucor hiemalis]